MDAGSSVVDVLLIDARRPRLRLFRWQVEKGQMIGTLVMTMRLRERGPAFLIHEPREGFRKLRVRIRRRLAPLGLDEERPAGIESSQGVVEPRGCRDEFTWIASADDDDKDTMVAANGTSAPAMVSSQRNS
jgi:hypothetical protein